MSRLEFVKTKVDIGLSFVYALMDGTFNKVNLYKGDTVTSLNYADHDEVKTVTGEISDIKVAFLLSNTGRLNKFDSSLENDARVYELDVVVSSDGKSKTVKIPAKDLMEYQPTGRVKDFKVIPVIKAHIESVLSDNTVNAIDLEEETELFNTTIINGKDEVTGNFKVRSFLYKLNKARTAMQVVGVNLIGDNMYKVPFDRIKNAGVTGIVADVTNVATSIKSVQDNKQGGIALANGEVTEDLTLTDSIVIAGNLSYLPATGPVRGNDKIDPAETVVKGALSVGDASNVTLSGVVLTEKAAINLGKAKTFTLKNSKIVNLTPTTKKTMGIVGTADEDGTGTVVDIEGCYFGTNTSNDTGSIYNFFELNTKLADGSKINNNYFAKSVCSHNVINIYSACDNATIEVAHNHFEYSANAMRIGIKGNRQNVCVNVHDNVYDETDTSDNGIWGGLVIIQPYGTQTTSFSGVTLKLDNNKGPGGQVVYAFYNKSGDTVMNADTLPKIIKDGKDITTDITILSM